MKPFLIVNFVFIFLILTASYVTDFILKCFNLTVPRTEDEITASTVIRVGYLLVLTGAWLWFRFSWKRKYAASLDPGKRTAASYSLGSGIRVAIIFVLGWIVFIVLKYVLKT